MQLLTKDGSWHCEHSCGVFVCDEQSFVIGDFYLQVCGDLPISHDHIHLANTVQSAPSVPSQNTSSMSCIAPSRELAYKPAQTRRPGRAFTIIKPLLSRPEPSAFAAKRYQVGINEYSPVQRHDSFKASHEKSTILSSQRSLAWQACPKDEERRNTHLKSPGAVKSPHEERFRQEQRSAAVRQVENWRNSEQSENLPLKQRYVIANARQQPPSTRTQGPRPGKYNRGLDSRWSEVMRYEVCQPGMIIRAPVHEHDFRNKYPDASVTLDNSDTVITKYGSVVSKLRWQVIIAKRGEHYTAVPLYTHEGKGLQNKSDSLHQEYVSIRDLRIQGNFLNQTPHQIVVAKMREGTTLLKPESTIRVTYPLNLKYDQTVEILGTLTQKSLASLKQLYNSRNVA